MTFTPSSDEIFYQLKRDMTLPYLDEDRHHHEVWIRQGDVFLLPRLVPHSLQRLAGTALLAGAGDIDSFAQLHNQGGPDLGFL